MSKERLIWVDVAKGICILLVVLNHTVEGILNAGVGERTKDWVFFHDVCYSFMVPVFFVFAGMFRKEIDKSSVRLAKIVNTILYPYLLWSTFQFLIKFVTASGNKSFELQDAIQILTSGIMQFWFLHALILISLLDIVLTKFKVNSQVRVLLALVAVFFGIPYLSIEVLNSGVWSSWIYFEVGILFGRGILSGVSNRLPVISLAGIITLVFLHLHGAGYPYPLRPVAAICGILACFALSKLLVANMLNFSAVLSYFGERSLQVYVGHVIFAAGIRELLLKFDVDSFLYHLILGCLLGVIVPIGLTAIDQKMGGWLFRWPRKKNNESFSTAATS